MNVKKISFLLILAAINTMYGANQPNEIIQSSELSDNISCNNCTWQQRKANKANDDLSKKNLKNIEGHLKQINLLKTSLDRFLRQPTPQAQKNKALLVIESCRSKLCANYAEHYEDLDKLILKEQNPITRIQHIYALRHGSLQKRIGALEAIKIRIQEERTKRPAAELDASQAGRSGCFARLFRRK